MNAVLIIAPRRDCDEYTHDLEESLVTCACQVSQLGWQDDCEREGFVMVRFYCEHFHVSVHERCCCRILSSKL